MLTARATLREETPTSRFTTWPAEVCFACCFFFFSSPFCFDAFSCRWLGVLFRSDRDPVVHVHHRRRRGLQFLAAAAPGGRGRRQVRVPGRGCLLIEYSNAEHSKEFSFSVSREEKGECAFDPSLAGCAVRRNVLLFNTAGRSFCFSRPVLKALPRGCDGLVATAVQQGT